MKKIISLCLFFTLLSCEDSLKDIEFISLKNPKVLTANAKKVDITVDCVLYNPNPVAVNLSNADFDIYISDKKMLNITQVIDQEMPASAEFTVPLRCKLSPKDIYGKKGKGLLNAALSILKQKQLQIVYKGNITAGKSIMNYKLEIVDSVALPLKF